jgi:serine phosphatase RsbU (regulator of sigma subunit)/HAMP domain-containing protein
MLAFLTIDRLPCSITQRTSNMRIGHLRNKLVLASLILIVPLMLWNVLVQIGWFHEQYDEELAGDAEVAKDVADVFAMHIYDVVALERAVGIALWGTRHLPRQEATQHLARISQSLRTVRHLYAADSSGRVFAANTPELIEQNRVAVLTVPRARADHDWVLSDVSRRPHDGAHVFEVATGIRDEDGRLEGTVVARVDERGLERALGRDIMGSHWLVVTDSKGAVALEHGNVEIDGEQSRWQNLPFVRAALAGKEGVVERLRMPDGRVMMGAAVPIPGCGWTATVLSPREVVAGQIRRKAVLSSLVILMLTGFVVGMGVYLGNRISKPAVELARAARQIGRGDLDARADVHTQDELEVLADTFNSMASALQERTTQLNTTLDSAHHQSELFSALYSVAQGLIVSMDLDERLEIIAHALASIAHAKRSAIFLSRGSRLVGAAGWNLTRPESFRDLSYETAVLGDLAAEILTRGGPAVIHDVRTDARVNPELENTMSDFGMRGPIILPLVRRQRLVAVMTLDNPGELADFDPEAVENAGRLADLAAIAIENAQVFEKERNIAHALQASLLPQSRGKMGAFDFACEYHAALEVAQLGGDLYDLIPLPEGRVGIVVADVSGKGLEAAVFTAMSKYTLRAFASENPDPGDVLYRTNESLTRAGGEWGFVTLAYIVLDTETGFLESANAGHPPYLLVGASGNMVELKREESNPPLGVFTELRFVQSEYHLAEGDVLVGYTDGVTGARRNGELFEIERLAVVVAENRHLQPEDITRAIYKAVLDYSGGSLQDDVALIVVKREGG